MSQTAVADSDTGIPLRELARRHGLSAAGKLPSLPEYSRQLWSYRHFIASYANAKVTSSLGKTRLGMIWQVLTPLINATVYYVIFGLVLSTARGVDNFVAYLCTGVFIFQFTQSVVQAGIQAISGNLGLIRALHFPRASLPLAITMVEVRNMIASLGVLMVIVLAFGEPITVEWLLVVPIFLLQSIFNAGLAMAAARLGSKVADFKQLVPFIMRIWLYGSAVLYPVSKFAEKLDGWQLAVVEANPLLVFIDLMRHALMEDVHLAASPLVLWLEAIGWTLVAGLGGYVYFWRGEKGYGRG
ncbi:transport permease protein [Actinoplanes sp. NBRC 14428]|uniref:Transport permease protein n=1 Tax=Pseudosporangium ferrugineum TaxID=439699 RepID=A0A2T0S7X4_9ACTN|nr:ABC transporter permease [Pseudosporangium ferrugineum]PRY29522.1 teichoic acid transport system permease protein [Pseudosporangium ferrugineum]BCJ52737.1 transport permease protein [Actinoplanes sp. NBRC 14428]